MSLISAELAAILVCPLTHEPLEEDARGFLISRAAGLAFPVRDGIPIMLPEEATPLSELDAEPSATLEAQAPQKQSENGAAVGGQTNRG